MENLSLPATFKTPEVQFDKNSGSLILKGRIFPENPKDFFKPLMDWIFEYAEKPKSETRFVLFLSYFNSSSNEYIFRICKKMEALNQNGCTSSIVWMYEEGDEDMKQMGEDFRELLKINFEIKTVT